MSKLTYRNGFIKLDSPRHVFYPGQVVLGSVVIELDQPLSLFAIHAKFLGEARVDWTERESHTVNGMKRNRDVEYVGREEYFNVMQMLAGGNGPINLPPGTHTYQFSYQLPPGVPSSFSGDRGGITYCITATIEFSGATHVQEKLAKYFEVVAPFDLNLGSPKLKEPIHIEFEEVLGCGCICSSDPISIRIRVPVSGYCPGQVIPVDVEVDNNSSMEVRKMVFEILTREKYHTQTPVSEYIPKERVLATEKRGAIMSGSKKHVTVGLPVPDFIAPNLENCGIIDVGYFFRVTVKLSGCTDDFQDEEEICLGLVPLNGTVDGEYTHPFSQSLPIGPIPDIPPPEENRQFEQQQAYPNAQAGYPNAQTGYPNTQTGYPNTQMGYPNTETGYPNPPPYSSDGTTQSSYFVKVQEQHFSSADPSKNYNIGFTMASPGADLNAFQQSWTMGDVINDLHIHLPPRGVNVNVPSAPPPSS